MFCQCVIDYDQDLGPGQFFVAENPLTAVSMHGPIVSWYSQPTHEVGTIINFIVFSL